MIFDHIRIASELERNIGVFSALLQDTDKNEQVFREATGKWSLLENLCHLVDEEKEDFRKRVKSVLDSPNKALNLIDPEGWVKQRNYQNQNFKAKLNEWVSERKQSVKWLYGLHNPPWDNTFHHPRLGKMSAWLFLCNWLSHDYHHIRQINTIKRAYLEKHCGVGLDYAGSW